MNKKEAKLNQISSFDRNVVFSCVLVRRIFCLWNFLSHFNLEFCLRNWRNNWYFRHWICEWKIACVIAHNIIQIKRQANAGLIFLFSQKTAGGTTLNVYCIVNSQYFRPWKSAGIINDTIKFGLLLAPLANEWHFFSPVGYWHFKKFLLRRFVLSTRSQYFTSIRKVEVRVIFLVNFCVFSSDFGELAHKRNHLFGTFSLYVL